MPLYVKDMFAGHDRIQMNKIRGLDRIKVSYHIMYLMYTK